MITNDDNKEQFSKMGYEAEIKRLEKRINDLEQTLTTGFIIAIGLTVSYVLSSLGSHHH
jgi:hypothetical protein